MRFAAKRLTRSDLTLFEHQFRRQNAGNQKAINLNRRVFVDLIFPGAPALAAGAPRQFPVSLRIFGPGGNRNLHQVMRKVIAAGGSQKNWRLNGETIPNPYGEPDRYNNLQDGDYTIMGFEGGNVPHGIDVILISQSEIVDQGLLAGLDAILGPSPMAVLSDDDLTTLLRIAPPNHPVGEFLNEENDELLEEAALGSIVAVRALRRRSVRRQTAEELAIARRRAEEIGKEGEVLVAAYLRRALADKRIEDFVWEADANAVNPWDFTVVRRGGTIRRIEVKSTKGSHNRALHVSQAEIEAAAEPDGPRTDLWRISQLDGDGGMLRRSINFRAVARKIISISDDCGPGLTPDGWTIATDRFEWSEPRRLLFGDEPDD